MGVAPNQQSEANAIHLNLFPTPTRREARALRSRVADLRLKVDETLSPAVLAARANTKLGMIPASPSSLRSLSGDAGTSIGLLPRLWARLERIGPLRS